MSESVKFPFWISIDELKAIERISNGADSVSALQRDDLAHFRNVVYRLREAFAGAPQPEPEVAGPGVTDGSKPPGATPVEPPASEPIPKLDCVGGEGGKITFSQIQK